jgi:outer membrane usher protein
MLLSPHENLGKRSVVAGQSLAENNYIGRSGALGSALNNFLGSYVTQSVQYDVEDPPTGYDIGAGVVRVRPPYRSGYALRIGTEAFVSAMGTLVRATGPVALVGGRVTLLDLRNEEKPQPIPFFTNSVGRFAIPNLLPGRRYQVETYGSNGTIDRSFEFTVPADSDGLVNLGTVQPGKAN